MEVLTAYVRENARRVEPSEGDSASTEVRVSTDIQAILTVLGRRDSTYERPEQRLDLRDTNLCGADLRDANLTRAHLWRANLTGTELTRANLAEAELIQANLTEAGLIRADLAGAYLPDANLAKANLRGANLTRAYLYLANLTGQTFLMLIWQELTSRVLT
jgi:uncharacterized protein YjbI with pentapeptide repeats